METGEKGKLLSSTVLIKNHPEAILRLNKRVNVGDRGYVVKEFLGNGTTGQVYKVADRGRVLALKLFYPIKQGDIFDTTSRTQRASRNNRFAEIEYDFLTRISHPNILHTYGTGELELPDRSTKRLPNKQKAVYTAIVTDYIDGSHLDTFLSRPEITPDVAYHVLDRLCLALQYLHHNENCLHLDIKASNILVRRGDGEPILIDFALAKNLNFNQVDGNESTFLFGNRKLFPTNLPDDHRLLHILNNGGTRAEFHRIAFPGLDLYQVGLLFQQLSSILETVLGDRELKYIRILAERMTDWEIVSKFGPKDLYPKVRRLAADRYSTFGVPELASAASAHRTIMIPPAVAVPITGKIQKLIDNRSFRRLRYINQLNFVSLVYPGAEHNRFIHSLYAYELTRQLTTQLYTEPLFRVLFGPKEVQQLLALSLLHDINHFPLLHIIQEAGIPGFDNKADLIDTFCKGAITGEQDNKQESLEDLISEFGLTVADVRRILFPKDHPHMEGERRELDCAMSSILNSGVDVDKLSYLPLDAYYTGVQYGLGIDLPCIIKAATMGRIPGAQTPHLAFTDRALQALENVVMTRLWNFRSIYWHHTHRAIISMITSVLRALYIDKRLSIEDYLADTMWKDDFHVLEYLDGRFKKHFGRDSILHGIIADRKLLYRRLYTVRPFREDHDDTELYQQISRFNLLKERMFCHAIGQKLKALISNRFKDRDIEDEEILVDWPRREISIGGPIYLATSGGRLELIQNISDPVRVVNKKYEELSFRMRIMINSKLFGELGEAVRYEQRKIIQALLTDALKSTKDTTDVK